MKGIPTAFIFGEALTEMRLSDSYPLRLLRRGLLEEPFEPLPALEESKPLANAPGAARSERESASRSSCLGIGFVEGEVQDLDHREKSGRPIRSTAIRWGYRGAARDGGEAAMLGEDPDLELAGESG